MEAHKLTLRSERAQWTRVINEEEAALTQESLKEEEVCIFHERLNQLHTDLKATDFDIVPLLSKMGAETQFDRVVEYNDRASTTSAKLNYRLCQLQDSQNRALPVAAPTASVSRTPQPDIQLPKIGFMKFDGHPWMWTPFWEQFIQLIHNNGGLTDVDRFVYLRSVVTGDAAWLSPDFQQRQVQNPWTFWNNYVLVNCHPHQTHFT